VERLRDVNVAPVCSPVLLNKIGGLAEPADLLRATLLHHVEFDLWMRWFATPPSPRLSRSAASSLAISILSSLRRWPGKASPWGSHDLWESPRRRAIGASL